MKYVRPLLWCLLIINTGFIVADSDDEQSETTEQPVEPPFNPLHRIPTGGLQTLFLPGPAVYHPTYGDFTKQNRLYVGAGTSGMKGYAITSFVALRSSVSMIPEQVIVNHGQDLEPHPVYDQKVVYMAKSGDNLAVITERDRNKIHVIENFGNPRTHVLKTDSLCDVTGTSTDVKITALAMGATGMEESTLRQYVFAAIKDAQGYDGIVVAKIDGTEMTMTTTDDDGNEQEETYLQSYIQVVDAENGTQHGNRALNIKPYISTLGECESYEITDLHWNQLVERLYITLRVKNSSVVENQASWTILMGRIVNDSLIIEPCMPTAYAAHAQAGFLAIGKGAQGESQSVTTFYPSLGGIYLLIQTYDQLHAFPIVNKSKRLEKENTRGVRALVMNDDEHGGLAAKDADLQDYCFRRTKRIHERYFEQPLNEDTHGFAGTDVATRVGGYVSLPGPIERVEFSGDAVLAAVKNTSGDELAGLFLSQPIYNEKGTVAAWSAWKRVAASKQPTVYGVFDLEGDNYVTLEYMVGEDEQLHGKVRMTSWENSKKRDSSDPFIAMLNEQFSSDKGGITSMSSHDGMSIIVGQLKVMIADVAREFTDESVCVASCYDGTLSSLRDADSVAAVEVCGGQLGEDPYLLSSAVVTDGNQKWLCVAGTAGVFVLSNDDGSGVAHMREYCTRAAHGMSFKKVSDFTKVKKIVASDQWLYVLTSRTLERYSFITGQPTILATSDEIGGLFNDVIVSSDLVLLATIKGVFHNGPGTSVRHADSSVALQWRHVELPEYGNYPIKKFFAVSPTVDEAGIAHGGQVFAVASSSRLQQTTIHRLFCCVDSQHGVTDHSVGLTPGYMFKGQEQLGFINCGAQRDGMYYDGIQTITYRGRVGTESPTMELAPSHLKTRSGIYTRDIGRVRHAPGIKHAYSINGVFLEPVTGRLVLYGDFGTRVHK